MWDLSRRYMYMYILYVHVYMYVNTACNAHIVYAHVFLLIFFISILCVKRSKISWWTEPVWKRVRWFTNGVSTDQLYRQLCEHTLQTSEYTIHIIIYTHTCTHIYHLPSGFVFKSATASLGGRDKYDQILYTLRARPLRPLLLHSPLLFLLLHILPPHNLGLPIHHSTRTPWSCNTRSTASLSCRGQEDSYWAPLGLRRQPSPGCSSLNTFGRHH